MAKTILHYTYFCVFVNYYVFNNSRERGFRCVMCSYVLQLAVQKLNCS